MDPKEIKNSFIFGLGGQQSFLGLSSYWFLFELAKRFTAALGKLRSGIILFSFIKGVGHRESTHIHSNEPVHKNKSRNTSNGMSMKFKKISKVLWLFVDKHMITFGCTAHHSRKLPKSVKIRFKSQMNKICSNLHYKYLPLQFKKRKQ